MFHLGKVVATPQAIEQLSPVDLLESLRRHSTGDWGEVCLEDCRANDDALRQGLRLLSAYRGENGTRFWIITEADRTVTTVLLPEEY